MRFSWFGTIIVSSVIAGGAFGYGVAVGKYEIFPYDMVLKIKNHFPQQWRTSLGKISPPTQKEKTLQAMLDNIRGKLSIEPAAYESRVAQVEDLALSDGQRRHFVVPLGFTNASKHEFAYGSAYMGFDSTGGLWLADADGDFFHADWPTDLKDGAPVSFGTVSSNILEFIDYPGFFLASNLGIKDVAIMDGRILISYSNQKTKDCFNTSILAADLDAAHLEFTDYFSPQECVPAHNDYGEFNPHQGGGRIIELNDNEILFSLGEYRVRLLAQDEGSLFGKVHRIDKATLETRPISMGHRNPQGLAYSAERDLVLVSEHGPFGGDELNAFRLDGVEGVANFGWPVSSYGEHYGSGGYSEHDKARRDDPKYQTAPLYKSHAEHGFLEPEVYWVPSIGASEIAIAPVDGEDHVFVSALGIDPTEGDMSIHAYRLEADGVGDQIATLPVDERIRDLHYHEATGMLYYLGETSGMIGAIDLSGDGASRELTGAAGRVSPRAGG